MSSSRRRELVRLLPPGQSTEALRELSRLLGVIVVQEAKQWSSYNVKPLTFVHRRQSALYAGPQEVVGTNLDYIISMQKADGGWVLPRAWEERNPAAWKLAEESGEGRRRWKTCNRWQLSDCP